MAKSATPEAVEERLREEAERFHKELASLRGRISDLEEDLEEEREKRKAAERRAETAYRMANRRATDDGKVSKTRAVEIAVRDELVRRIVSDTTAQDRPMKVGECRSKAQTRANPYDEFAYSIITHAWDNLVEEWPCFHETAKRGDKALGINPDDVPCDLALVVEESLDRDDVTKRFCGDEEVPDR